MKLEPVITEKSMSLVEEGKYTFKVGKKLNKYQIRKLIEKTFNVHVTDVRTINKAGGTKTTLTRQKKVVKPVKKAIVVLKDKEKIDIFEKTKK